MCQAFRHVHFSLMALIPISYLSTEHGVCIGNEIVAHLLWADDLILFSDTFHGLQKQLHGLKKFCSINHMIVNEMKTKVMIFGNPKRSKLYFNEKVIEEVSNYKYLVISSARQNYPTKIRSKVHTSFWATKLWKLYLTWNARSNL